MPPLYREIDHVSAVFHARLAIPRRVRLCLVLGVKLVAIRRGPKEPRRYHDSVGGVGARQQGLQVTPAHKRGRSPVGPLRQHLEKPGRDVSVGKAEPLEQKSSGVFDTLQIAPPMLTSERATTK